MSDYLKEHGFSDLRACDAHIHIIYPHPIEETEQILRSVCGYFAYDRIAIMSMTESSNKGCDPFANVKALYLRERLGVHHYAFGSLFHWYDGRDTAQSFLEQVRKIDALGFDGVKMLEGKPIMRKRFAHPLDDPILDGFWGYIEARRLPITMHLTDPSDMWDRSKCSEYAIRAGWFCDETFPTRRQLFAEMEGFMRKFPALRLTLAHLFNVEETPRAAAQFLEAHEYAGFDLTPGDLMRLSLREPENWRAFYRDYSTRLMYGTDTYNISRDGKTPEEAWGYRPTHLRMFLEGQEDFEYAGDIIQPLKLDGRQKRLILRDNLIAHLGECHRPADYALAAEECARLREMLKKGEFGDRVSGERIPMESRNLEVMEAFFRGQPAVR